MSRKRKTPTTVQDGEVQWNDDDFNLDSHGVEAPLRERLESLREGGFTSEQVSIDIQEKYAKYLERMARKSKSIK